MLRFAVIGIGAHAKKNIIPALVEASNVELTALGSQTLESYRDIPVYRQYLAAIEAADAVWIATPNHLHANHCLLALKAGKHVLCEKPLCLSTGEAQSIALSQGKLRVVEGFAYRHHPLHSTVRRLLPSIGKLKRIEVRYSYFLDDTHNIRLRSETGGGALNDVGCYGVDYSRFITQREPLELQAELFMRNGIDEHGKALMEFEGGVTAKLFFSCRDKREDSVRLIGEKGNLFIPRAFHLTPKQRGVINCSLAGKAIEKITVPPANQYALAAENFSCLSPLPLDRGNIAVLEKLRGSPQKR